MNRILQILFWSVISAAFIGPGTITTAASSGTKFGFNLLWALIFSTIACLTLQEAGARITVVSGSDLGQAIQKQFSNSKYRIFVFFLVIGAIILGCAAYEAGNILGSVAGASLNLNISPKIITIAIVAIAGLMLYFGTIKTIAHILGVVVALMGVTFLVTAISIRPSIISIIKGSFIPSIPQGSEILVLALVGTTVVPYNLFLGSGIAKGQSIGELRFGLSIAVIFGGIISMGVLVVGTSINGVFSFENLSNSLSNSLGNWAGVFFSIGLFSAGFSSALTAPLAASITARSLFEKGAVNKWEEKSWNFRLIWGLVLLSGLIFGLIRIKPIPAIIFAQALNGLLLPFISIFLFILVNDVNLMGPDRINGKISNLIMFVVVVSTIILGISNFTKAISKIFGLTIGNEKILLNISVIFAFLLVVSILIIIIKKRKV